MKTKVYKHANFIVLNITSYYFDFFLFEKTKYFMLNLHYMLELMHKII